MWVWRWMMGEGPGSSALEPTGSGVRMLPIALRVSTHRFDLGVFLVPSNVTGTIRYDPFHGSKLREEVVRFGTETDLRRTSFERWLPLDVGPVYAVFPGKCISQHGEGGDLEMLHRSLGHCTFSSTPVITGRWGHG